MIYRHIVIIQDNQQIIRVGRRIIQPLEGEILGHSAIPDHGDHAAIRFPNFKAEATDIPSPQIEFEACPAIKASYSLSAGLGNPLIPLNYERAYGKYLSFPWYFMSVSLMPDIRTIRS